MCAFASVWKNLSFYEEHNYFLHDTHNGTVFSNFSSIYWPRMEMKTCQFGTISDSAARSTSCQRFFKIHLCCKEKNLISNSGRALPTLTTSLSFPCFLNRKWKWRRANSGLFLIQPRAPSPAGVFCEYFFCRESLNFLPFKTLILTPPSKNVKNFLPLRFCQKFFCVRVANIIIKLINKTLPVGTRCQSSFIFGNG